jgi:hypothetical protein
MEYSKKPKMKGIGKKEIRHFTQEDKKRSQKRFLHGAILAIGSEFLIAEKSGEVLISTSIIPA